MLRLCLLFALIAGACAGTSAAARASLPYVDRRVTAIPAQTIATSDPRLLVDARRQQIGTTLERYFEPLYFLWAGSQIVALFFFWRLGGAARMRDALRRRIANVTLLRFAYGVGLTGFGTLAAAPTSFARYRLANYYDLAHQSLGSWLSASLANFALDALGVGIVTAIVFALVDRTRLWWAISIGVLFLATLGINYLDPVAIAPLFDRMGPISPHSAAGRRIDTLERRAHLQNVPDFRVSISRRTGIVQGRADGFLNTKRIVIADTALAALTDGELDVLVANALGHYVVGDGLKKALLGTLLFIVCIALGVMLADRAGFRRDDDQLARLALVGAFVGIAGLIALPGYHYVERRLGTAADAYALRLTGDRVAAIRLYVRVADESLEPLCPGRIQRWYFAQQPPPAERIAQAAGRPDRCR